MKSKINYALKEYAKRLAWGFYRQERCNCPSGNGPLSLYIGDDDKIYLVCPYNDENGNNGCEYKKEFIPEEWVKGIERERASKQIGDVWDD